MVLGVDPRPLVPLWWGSRRQSPGGLKVEVNSVRVDPPQEVEALKELRRDLLREESRIRLCLLKKCAAETTKDGRDKEEELISCIVLQKKVVVLIRAKKN